MLPYPPSSFFFFFNDTATTEIYTLSLHDALPISDPLTGHLQNPIDRRYAADFQGGTVDRKSTRLNSSHLVISYAVFCLKKKKKNYTSPTTDSTELHATPTTDTRDSLLHNWLSTPD